MKGTIKRFYFRKGFGFIEGEPGSEYFFHYSEFTGEKRLLRAGLEVEFEPRTGEKGPAATAIRALGAPAAESRPSPARTREVPVEAAERRASPWVGFAAGLAVGVVLGAGLYAVIAGMI